MNKKTLGIGLIGAGTVGGGVIKILENKAELLFKRSGFNLEIVKAADLDTDKLISLGIDKTKATNSADEVINDKDVDVIIELVGGTGIAYEIVEKALNAGKHIVTANKALLAERGEKLFTLAEKNEVAIAFEAAVAGAIPIIKAIRDGLSADTLQCLLGIVNGTCNYILTEMISSGKSYADALKDAQSLGFAEADPTFDVEGNDSAHKLTLLSQLGFGTSPDFTKINIEGISNLSLEDVASAAKLGYKVKLLAVARPINNQLFLSVHPALLKENHPLANVMGSMNAISLFADNAQESMFYGRGAGEMPTASAVVADIVEIARSGSSDKIKSKWIPDAENTYDIAPMNDYHCRFFVRFTVSDGFGILGKIASILGEKHVSIKSVEQNEANEARVPIVILTQVAKEGNLREAVKEIEALDFNLEPAGILRIEE